MHNFKIGDEIRCTNIELSQRRVLTPGNIYILLGYDSQKRVIVMNNLGELGHYYQSRFEKVGKKEVRVYGLSLFCEYLKGRK